MIILGNWNAQIRHNEVTSNGNYGYTTRTNRNGKILRDFLNKYNLAIINSYFATGAKNTKSHVTYYSKHKNNQKRSEIDFIIACKGSTPLFRKIRIKRKLGEKIHNRTEFDHQPVEALVSQKFRKCSNQKPKMHRNYKEFFKIDANRWKLNEEIRQGFEEEIAKLPPPNNSGKQPRLNFQTFKSTIKQAIGNCIPLVAHERLYKTSSERTETLFEIRRRLWKSLTENESKILKKMIRKSTLNDYKAWLNLQVRRVDTSMAKNDIHEAFKQAERIVGKKRKPQRTITMEDGKHLNDKKRVKVFQEYLELTQRNREGNIMDTELDIPEAKAEDTNISPPTLEELEETAKTLKNYKVPGPDGITNEILKNNKICLGPGTALVRSRKGTTAVAAAELNFLYNNIPIEENLETNLGTIKGVKTFRYLGVDITAIAETHVNPSARIRAVQETLRKLQPILRSSMLTARRKKNIVKALVVSKIQYGSEFWNMENKDTSKALNKLSRDIKRTLLQPNPTQPLEHTKQANTLKAGDINILKILKEKQKSWLETCTTAEIDMELAESSRKLEAYLFPQTATPTEDLNVPLEQIREELEHHEPRPPLHPPPPGENSPTPPQTTP
eukprot:augustus_masked-scaffold_28-processed-gene-0.36-mRNA-1 protein AED:1.00 eAED:1.00 QI:0/0/0/0/1/1/2/0/612